MGEKVSHNIPTPTKNPSFWGQIPHIVNTGEDVVLFLHSDNAIILMVHTSVFFIKSFVFNYLNVFV